MRTKVLGYPIHSAFWLKCERCTAAKDASLVLVRRNATSVKEHEASEQHKQALQTLEDHSGDLTPTRQLQPFQPQTVVHPNTDYAHLAAPITDPDKRNSFNWCGQPTCNGWFKPVCGATSEQFVCTMPKGHNTNHEAWSAPRPVFEGMAGTSKLLHIWAQSKTWTPEPGSEPDDERDRRG